MELKKEDQTLSSWKADVLKWATNTNIGIILKKGIRNGLGEGDIALEDIFDMNYRNSICTFKVDGKTLKDMMNFNIKLREGNRCQISGFNLTYRGYKKPEKNTIIDCSLNPDGEYTVAISDYLAERAKRFLGKEMKYENTGIMVNKAVIDWFEEFEQINEITPCMKIIKID